MFLFAAAFNPDVQTWMFNRALGRHPDLHASVESVSAGWSELHLVNLRLTRGSAVLMLPQVDAELPMKAAVWNRELLVHRVVAKGWILDLTGKSSAPTATIGVTEVPATAPTLPSTAPATPTATTENLLRVIRSLVVGAGLPPGVSIAELELDGNVLVPSPGNREGARVHVLLNGSGLAAGRSGEFTLETTAGVGLTDLPVRSARGQLIATVDAAGAFSRVEFTGTVTSDRGTLPDDLRVAAALGIGSNGGQDATIDVTRGERHVVTAVGHRGAGQPGVAGTWKIDLRDTDVAGIFPNAKLPTTAVAGEGHFDADTRVARVHANGRMNFTTTNWRPFGSTAATPNRLALAADFDLTHAASAIHFERLSLMLTGTRPIATVKAAQPFDVNESTGAVQPAKPAADWLEGSLQGFSLDALPALSGNVALTGADITGNFSVSVANAGFAVRSNEPFTASGVTITRGGSVVAKGVDLAVALRAHYTPGGEWDAIAAPLELKSAGHTVASIEATLTPVTEPYQRFALVGKWRADLDALKAVPQLAGAGGIRGKSASGDFTAKLGIASEVKGSVTVIGHAPAHVVNATVSGSFADYGAAFRVPIKVSIGPDSSEFSIEGTFDQGTRKLEAEVNSVKLALDPLVALAGEFPLAGEPRGPDTVAPAVQVPAAAQAMRPFWGDVTGRIACNVYGVTARNHEFHDVRATIEVTHDALRLTGGNAVLSWPIPAKNDRRADPFVGEEPPSTITAEGALAFSAGTPSPYSLKGSVATELNSPHVFGPAPHGDAVIEGRFVITDTIVAEGAGIQDLVNRPQEEIHVTAKGGALRILKTNIAAAIPEAQTPVKDAVSTAASALGSLMGIRGNPLFATNTLTPTAEAVLDFTRMSAEFRYDELELTANRSADQAIRLTQIAVVAPNYHLTGTGEIAPAKDRPLGARPLLLDLQLGVKGVPLQRLTTAGLVSTEHDALGYLSVREPIHFGGTLQQIDASQWRSLLVKAALAPRDSHATQK